MKRKIFYSSAFQKLIFWSLLLIIGFIYSYNQSITYRPQSIHAWRQADCASITLNYYQDDMNPLHPQVHNLTSDGGTTGYAATSEMPVLYYFSAILYKIFGPHEILIRLINLFIFFLGLFYLFRTLILLLDNKFWAMLVPLLVFTSPVLVYYGNNFLTNVSALSFAFIAIYYFARYMQNQRLVHLLKMMGFFLFAGIFKLPALMSLFAIAGYLVFNMIFGEKKTDSQNFPHKLYFFTGIGLILLIIGSWVLYAHRFNEIHECYYFSTTVFPLWKMSGIQIRELISHVWTYWRTAYFHDSLHLVFLISAVYTIWNLRKLSRMHLAILIFLVMQFFVFVVLQFQTFYNHDYYTINLNILPISFLVSALWILKKQKPEFFNGKWLKIGFGLLLILNVYHAANQQQFRINAWPNKYYQLKADVYDIEPYLREIGLAYDDKVIFIPDGSNVSLCLMNQHGWTQYQDARFNRAEPILYNQDIAGIEASIERGAKYLIVNNPADLETYPYVKPFASHLVGKYKSILIFDLQDTVRNFNPDEKSVLMDLFCNAEMIQNQKFLCADSLTVIGNVVMQSDEHVFDGDFSCRTDKNKPYGFAWELPEGAKQGEMFEVSVWRYGGDAEIIASADDASYFYLNNAERVETKGAWEKLVLSFAITEKMHSRHLKIYLYNSGNNPVWFDNYRIVRYADPFDLGIVTK
ncbi:MAG: glycosyltransferase family 39 protein [Bacteroidota bacterium]|nr:glycosyltransferase family 39 protein [Bacteroidota bacterium]